MKDKKASAKAAAAPKANPKTAAAPKADLKTAATPKTDSKAEAASKSYPKEDSKKGGEDARPSNPQPQPGPRNLQPLPSNNFLERLIQDYAETLEISCRETAVLHNTAARFTKGVLLVGNEGSEDVNARMKASLQRTGNVSCFHRYGDAITSDTCQEFFNYVLTKEPALVGFGKPELFKSELCDEIPEWVEELANNETPIRIIVLFSTSKIKLVSQMIRDACTTVYLPEFDQSTI